MTIQTKISCLVALLVFGLGIALWIAQPEDRTTNNSTAGHNMPTGAISKNQLSSDIVNYDFGTISMKDGKVSKLVTSINNNPETISIQKLYTSCMCTEAFMVKNGQEIGPFGMPGHGALKAINENVKPSETLQIKVVFDPNAHGPSGVGIIERDVAAEDESGKILNFHFKANVIP
jgi:hypothetical protein